MYRSHKTKSDIIQSFATFHETKSLNKYITITLPEADCEDIRDVLDPMHVPSRGALKKMLKSSTATANKSKTKCSLCKVAGHNRRKCPTGDEVFQCSS